MSPTICGHERGILRRALYGWQIAPTTTRHIIDGAGEFSDAERDARRDADDPAKLAEMLATRGRELGLYIDVEARENGVTIRIEDGLPLPPLRFRTMASARAILLQWLQLPGGAREEAERRLRGET